MFGIQEGNLRSAADEVNGSDAVPRILVADDHPVVRAGYKQFLQKEFGVTAVGEAAGGTEMLDLLRRARWDLLILDLHMPDSSGIEILHRLKTRLPEVTDLGDE